MDDDRVLSTLEHLDEDGNKADLRVQTGAGEFRARSSYYDDDERLILVDYTLVDPEEIPDGELSDRRRGYDRYLKQEEIYYRVEEIMMDPLIGESPGWEVAEESEPAATFMPVDGRYVVREAGDMPLPTFVLYSHYNLRGDVFDDAGLWDDIMGDEPEGDA